MFLVVFEHCVKRSYYASSKAFFFDSNLPENPYFIIHLYKYNYSIKQLMVDNTINCVIL